MNGVAQFTANGTAYGNLNLEMRRGVNNVDDLSIDWGSAIDANGTRDRSDWGVLSDSRGVYQDYFRNGDGGRSVGLRLNGLDAGTYEIFTTIIVDLHDPNAIPNFGSRSVGIGVFSGTMPNSTLIADLDQTTTAQYADYASLATWVPSPGAGDGWNVLRAVVNVSGPNDWVVIHLENPTVNTAGANNLGISSLHVTYSPAPAPPDGPPASFEEWISRYSGIPADQSGRLATPAGDGTANLLKYALGLAPLDDAAHRLPAHWTQSDGNGGVDLYLSYARLAGGTDHGEHHYEINDLVYRIGVSEDLTAWSLPKGEEPALVERVGDPMPDPEDPAVEHVTVRLQSPLDPANTPRAFLRLYVEQAGGD